jgi:ABC-type nitrate/sulfonate/bicarbonate transport system ATPase subunit
LDRFCQRVLSEVARLSSDVTVNPHERYLAVFDLINRRNDELADAFDDMRRSTALRRLACIQSHCLLTDEEFGRFSASTRDAIEAMLSASA